MDLFVWDVLKCIRIVLIKQNFWFIVPLWCAAVSAPSSWTALQQFALQPFSHSSLIGPHSRHSGLKSHRRRSCKRHKLDMPLVRKVRPEKSHRNIPRAAISVESIHHLQQKCKKNWISIIADYLGITQNNKQHSEMSNKVMMCYSGTSLGCKHLS